MKPRALRPYEDALAELLGAAAPLPGTETLPTLAARDRVLARPLASTLDVPPMDNTQMDGYAVRVADLADGRALPISQRIPAGHVGGPLEPGTVARIFTGAMVPPGADAVIMQEQADVDGDRVVFRHRPASGEWIRRRGEDIAAGDIILRAGDRLTPQALGLAASVGAASVEVHRCVRVACFFTGDELTMPGEPLAPGAIYNSNRYVLTALFAGYGCEVHDLGIVPDSLDATRRALREAAAQADLIVTSGGVSVGEEDHVKPAVEAEGRLSLWQIAIKPGKPLAYGQVRRESGEPAHFIGLPGNPVSSLVTALLFVRPFVRRLQGRNDVAVRALSVPSGFDWPRPDKRREFLRVRLDDDGRLALFRHQGSAVLTSTVWGDGLAEIAPGQSVATGDPLRFLPFAHLLHD